MYRRFADAGWRLEAGGWVERLGFVLVGMLLLSACGSAPDKAEVPPPVAIPDRESDSAASPPASSLQSPAASEIPIPPEAQQQFDSAVAAMSSGNLAGAEQAFRSLSDTYPAYSGPLLNLAILQAKGGRLADAEKTLTAAIERNDSAAAFNQLGIVYRRLGRFKEADEAYERAIQVDPGYALAHLNLGVLCDLYLQQPQRALEAYERYLALAATPDAKVAGWVTELKTRLGNQQRSAQAEQ
jgi:tetratricopeptide (TPR) repeat protein